MPQTSVSTGFEPASVASLPHKEKPVSKRETLPTSKSDIVLKKLRSAKGATIAMLTEATGWQAHSVRGFLSAVVRKKLALNLQSEPGKDGLRRYRIVDANEANG